MKKMIYNTRTKTRNPVCGYKWGWSTVNLMAAKTNSCHRVLEDDIPDDDFSGFHNTKNKLETRKLMLSGEWPGKGCEYCRDIEEANGISDRIDFNSKEDNLRYIPIEFNSQPNPIEVSPTILEMYFSNLCNLGCIYCHPRYSSVLENESKKFDDTPWHISDLSKRQTGYSHRLESFWSWFKENAHTLKRYNILGGEPFFQPEFYKNLEYLENIKLPDLDFCVFSNLKIKKEKLHDVATRLSNLKQNGQVRTVKITCSIDCWGPQQEYVRTGLSMKSWEENFDMLVKEFPEIELEMHGTITCLTIKTMPELLLRWTDWNNQREDNIILSHNFCHSPDYYSPFIFGPNFFNDDFENILKILKPEKYIHDSMVGYRDTINNKKTRNRELIRKLKEELEKNDNRRGSDYTKVFQWVADYKV
jgi:hypothetical protein